MLADTGGNWGAHEGGLWDVKNEAWSQIDKVAWRATARLGEGTKQDHLHYILVVCRRICKSFIIMVTV